MISRRQLLAGLGAAATVTLLDPAALLAATPGSVYTPITPQRLVDTRIRQGGRRVNAGGTLIIPTSKIAPDAAAVVVNIVAVQPGNPGFITAYPNGATSLPNASNLNYSAGQNRANLATVRVGNGAINLYSHAGCDLVVDIVGYWTAAAGPTREGRLITQVPARAYDSRNGRKHTAGEWRTITLPTVPAGATAAVINLTVTQTDTWGHAAALPHNADTNIPPGVSSINWASASTVANQTIVPLSGDNRIRVFTHSAAQVIVDVAGYITGSNWPASTDGQLVTLPAPVRMCDTRTANSPLGDSIRLWGGWHMTVPLLDRGGIPGRGVAGVVGNITIVDAHDRTHLTAYPAGYWADSTSVNNADRAGQTCANHHIAAVGTAGLGIYNHNGSHIVYDVMGWIRGATLPTPRQPTRTQDMPAIAAWPLTVTIPKLGVRLPIAADATDRTLDTGVAGWIPGTAWPGKTTGETHLLAHRTSAGGPFRHINLLTAGDIVVVEGDRRRVEYRVEGWRIDPADKYFADVKTAKDRGPATLALAACSRTDGQPTDTNYRIVVICRQISIRNT